MTRPRILIVGAGAVGQVYARHLQRGGAQIGVFVREKYVAACEAGLPIYPLNQGRAPTCQDTLRDLQVCTTPEQVQTQHWDQIWLCVSSTGLRGPWLPPILRAAPDADVITLQPGLEDRAFLLEMVDEARLVTGLIGFLAWQAPLPGATLDGPDGIAYWIPPLAPMHFSGPEHSVQQILQILRRGGIPVKKRDNLHVRVAVYGAAMSPAMAALESAGWSLRTFRRGPAARLAADAARQSMALAADYHGLRPPLIRLLVRPLLMRAIALLGPIFAPLDLELYLKYHFTKVGDQTRAYLKTTTQQAQRRNLPAGAVQKLRQTLSEQSET